MLHTGALRFSGLLHRLFRRFCLFTLPLFRFQNRALKDTVARVGADPVRKLRRNDRIVGAALFAMDEGVDPAPIIRGIVAGLKFNHEGDPTAPEIQKALSEQGIDYVIEHYMGLEKTEPLFGMIKAAYEA